VQTPPNRNTSFLLDPEGGCVISFLLGAVLTPLVCDPISQLGVFAIALGNNAVSWFCSASSLKRCYGLRQSIAPPTTRLPVVSRSIVSEEYSSADHRLWLVCSESESSDAMQV
jgi:biotin transporter BioY